MSLRPAEKSQDEGRFADIAFTTIAGDGHGEASARKAAKTHRTRSPFESHIALNQRRSCSRSGSVSNRPDFGVPAALIVCGVFSPGWHHPMRSKTAEKAAVSALTARTRSPISLAAA